MGKRTAVYILMTLVLAGFETAMGAPATPALIAEVLAALDKGDAQGAATLANVALREDGVSASQQGSLLLYRGLARELLGENDSALEDLTRAIDTNALPPDEREQAFLQRGFLRDALGRLNEAIGDYTSVIESKGASSATALNNRANIYRRQNRLGQARRDYLAALSVGGGKAQYSYYGLGQIAEAQHDVRSARDFYVKATIIEPNYAAASGRLTVLGAPPTGVVLPQEEKIILRPPPHANAGTYRQEVRPRPLRSVNFTTRLVPAMQPALRLRPALDQAGTATSLPRASQIQLGAWRSPAEARAAWDSAKAMAGTVLDGLSPQILIADVPGKGPGKGRFFRLRVNLEAGQNGAGVCASLKARDIVCIPVPG
ncbi:MAG TPA: tetratricopeptide repeat protein [Rhizomicrobium sp.]|nr:tetratricopeptide repeat protein [Rhizomicrobium sp.]